MSGNHYVQFSSMRIGETNFMIDYTLKPHPNRGTFGFPLGHISLLHLNIDLNSRNMAC